MGTVVAIVLFALVAVGLLMSLTLKAASVVVHLAALLVVALAVFAMAKWKLRGVRARSAARPARRP